MKTTFAKYFIVAFLFTLSLESRAKEVPPKPAPPRLVNDYTGILSRSEAETLERKLVAYNDSTSTQIAIVVEQSLEGDDDFDYSYRLASAWGIGGKENSNGILIYVALDDRKIRIQTGYGTEGFLPDAMAKRIIEQVIVPSFRQQSYFQGFDRATDIIIQLGKGEYVNEGDSEDGFPWQALLFIIIFIIIIIIISRGSGGGGYYRGGRYDSGGGWIIFGPGSGSGGGSNWGGGGGGGFGGGGFGGFGGGGFGGGGAGGSW
jgi:uncharacterized protein